MHTGAGSAFPYRYFPNARVNQGQPIYYCVSTLPINEPNLMLMQLITIF